LEARFGLENALVALPDDCWETIASHMLFDCSAVLYFVSKQFQEAYLGILNNKFSNKFGKPQINEKCF
jgi:hypothetical protein